MVGWSHYLAFSPAMSEGLDFWTTNPPVSDLGVDPGPADFPVRTTVAGGSVTLRLPLLSLHECSHRQGDRNQDCADYRGWGGAQRRLSPSPLQHGNSSRGF